MILVNMIHKTISIHHPTNKFLKAQTSLLKTQEKDPVMKINVAHNEEKSKKIMRKIDCRKNASYEGCPICIRPFIYSKFEARQ